MLSNQGRKPSSVAPTALTFITIGGLVSVWSGVWFVYERNHGGSDAVNYICAGLLMTGIGALIVGLVLGRIAHRASSVEIAQDEAKIGAIVKEPAIAHKV
jgi:F0F1-type ATP synthase membrane subunit c/vacuolar-type H+-ATPase subunit K